MTVVIMKGYGYSILALYQGIRISITTMEMKQVQKALLEM